MADTTGLKRPKGGWTAVTLKALTKPGFHRDRGDGAAVGLFFRSPPRSAVALVRVGCIGTSRRSSAAQDGWASARFRCSGCSEARDMATAARKSVKLGVDPINERQKAKQAQKVEAAKVMTFEQCAEKYIQAHQAAWSQRHAFQWPASLTNYVHPVVGHLPVAAIDTALVMKVLEPIWGPKNGDRWPCSWPHRVGARLGESQRLPGRWRIRPGGVATSTSCCRPNRSCEPWEHYAALPYAELPQFMAEVRQRDGIAARALEFTASQPP